MVLQTLEGQLATYASADELYRARGGDVNRRRPVFTGDVFANLAIAGVEPTGMAMLVSQPCTMRQGARLRPKMLAVAVKEKDALTPDRWVDGFFKEHPLPELYDSTTFHAAHFPLMGQIDREHLDLDQRVACLSDTGVDLLHQRFVWNMTRVLVKLQDIRSYTRSYFDEAEMLEVWRDRLCDAGMGEQEATERFDTYLSAERRRELLADSDYASQVRRECEREAKRLEQELMEGPPAPT
jgi:hypothetical protein